MPRSAGASAAWDALGVGGGPAHRKSAVRRQALVYDFRLQHGFTDVADAAFDRLLCDADAAT